MLVLSQRVIVADGQPRESRIVKRTSVSNTFVVRFKKYDDDYDDDDDEYYSVT